MIGRGPRRSGLVAVIVAAASVAAVARAELRPVRPPERQRPAPSGAERMCTKRLVVTRTTGAEGCFIDERVTRVRGVLRYACDGTGPATATFAEAVFRGRIEGGQVDVLLNTDFNFSDGCVWTTEQHLRGAISNEALDYSYAERPREGQQGCSASCRAHARARIVSAGASR